jgi:hypothetical protein
MGARLFIFTSYQKFFKMPAHDKALPPVPILPRGERGASRAHGDTQTQAQTDSSGNWAGTGVFLSIEQENLQLRKETEASRRIIIEQEAKVELLQRQKKKLEERILAHMANFRQFCSNVHLALEAFEQLEENEGRTSEETRLPFAMPAAFSDSEEGV